MPKRALLLAEDETTLRLLPPLRAAWALRGHQAEVPISGHNAQRTLFGALNVCNGRRVLLRRAHACAPDFQAFLRELRRHYRAGQPLWLLLDKAPCHVAAGSLALAAELNITFLWLPRQCSELNAMDHLWRHLKNDLAANRQRPHIEALAQQAETWTLALSPQETLRKAGLLSKDCWLKNVRTNFCLGT
jgi:transposase